MEHAPGTHRISDDDTGVEQKLFGCQFLRAACFSVKLRNEGHYTMW